MGATPPPPPPSGWGQNPPPPPNWGQSPPPPAWSPQGQPPASPMGQNQNPMMAMQNRMEKMEHSASAFVTIFRLLGFVLIFVAALVVVIGTNPPSGCITSPSANCTQNYLSGAATATLIGRILLVLGFSAIIVGSALRMQYSLKPTAESKPEEYNYLAWERRFNGLVIIVSLVLMFLVIQLVPNVSVGGISGGL